jgi:hypothetical protein
LLRRKNKGDASALVGRTAMLLFFVNDKISQWTPSARQKFSKTHDDAMKTITEKAKDFSVSVTIDTFVEEVTVPLSAEVGFNPTSEVSDEWIDWIMSKYSKKFFKGYRKHYKETLGYDQVAVAFAFNRDFRACAQQAATSAPEYSFLDAYASERTIIHELFHQFGAEDIYIFENCMESVRKLNYASVMAYKGGIHIDSITAYVIGWSNEIDDSGVKLLELIKHLKLKDVIAFRKRS